MVKMKLFVEGGGEKDKILKKQCRRGFREFLEKEPDLRGKMPRIVACGSRKGAYDNFKIAIENDEPALLLVDAEAPVTARNQPWAHLKSRSGDKWECPSGSTNDQCHLMVQIMESWFLADPDALEEYYGQNFNRKALRQNPNIEDIPKKDVLDGLKNATRKTKKGGYSDKNRKGKHSFEILERIDPEKVRKASLYAERFISAL